MSKFIVVFVICGLCLFIWFRLFEIESSVNDGTILATTCMQEVSLLDTDNLAEGSVNQYFSNSLARGAISLASGETNLSYNSSNGELSLPQLDGGTF